MQPTNLQQTNQMRRDFNVIVGQGKNWNIPFFWGPVLRYISAPILAIVASFAYPDFYARGRMDPIHIAGFTFAHVSLFLAVAGLIVPRAFDVFVMPERRKDCFVVAQPQAINPRLLVRAEGTEGVEESAIQSPSPADSSDKKAAY
jgi:solute carrier family 6 GABA transporter-like protein 1